MFTSQQGLDFSDPQTTAHAPVSFLSTEPWALTLALPSTLTVCSPPNQGLRLLQINQPLMLKNN